MLLLAKGNFLCKPDKALANEVKEVKRLYPSFYVLAPKPPLVSQHQAGAYIAIDKSLYKATIFAITKTLEKSFMIKLILV